MPPEPHPHIWITIFDEVRCDLCGSQQGSRLGDNPCTVPHPEPPPRTHANRMWRLIFTDKPADIAALEAELEGTQAEAVGLYDRRNVLERGPSRSCRRQRHRRRTPHRFAQGLSCQSYPSRPWLIFRVEQRGAPPLGQN